ncbi:MAG: EAL domain-containing protein [Thiogranum sp.]|nr:EAL domain-containing protein [Thiogranum sp.]
MATATETTPASRFISLKWKALFFLSLVLVAINGAFTVSQYLKLKQGFNDERQALHTRNDLILAGLLQQSATRLQQLAELIPWLSGMERALSGGNAGQLRDTFAPHWPLMQLDMNIEGVGFFRPDNSLIAAWGWLEDRYAADQQMMAVARGVTLTERPATAMDCDLACIQYAVIPLLVDEQRTGSTLVGASLADVIVDFSRSTRLDVGVVIIGQPSSSTDAPTVRPLPEWGARVPALTRADSTFQVVRQAASRFSLEALAGEGRHVKSGSRTYDVWAASFEKLGQHSGGYLLMLDDISADLAQIRQATNSTLAFGVAGLVTSEAVLLLVLWAPLSRLRRVVSALPLLAQSAFQQARDTMAVGKRRFPHLRDEIDHLDTSAVALSHQLEKLETKVAQRTRSLAEKMSELTRERDFVRGLLDTAQVLIITQTPDGYIRLVNRYTEFLTGYPGEELIDRNFTDLHDANSLPPEFRHKLQLVAAGRRANFQHESVLETRNAQKRTITWLHGRLDGDEDSAPVILTVGLDITDRKEAESRLAWLASHDPLTGLFNRRRFQEEFELAVKLARRHNRSGALLFLDLDHLKYINDTSGHKVGDAIIKVVSNDLVQMHRDTDIIARLGGDEFAIGMPDVSTEDACNVARKINEHLNRLVVPAGDRSHKVSASIGIAMFPEHGTRVDELLANADIAMYQAKDLGRGGWHLFSEEEQVRERLRAHVYWKDRIEQAVASGSFVLFYQPILDIQTGTTSHYEVLLRMKDSDGSLLAPGAFVEVAEKTGQIHAIDHWVLQTAIASLQQHLLEDPDATFAINLSAYAFMDPDLLPLLRRCLADSGIPAERLIFEITETAALSDFAAACTLMQQIRDMGCKFALDDFGVGFSSFYYLKQLPVDYVKIDGSFIKDLANSADDRILVKAMGEIAHGFGKKTVAEFVEDAETLQLLREFSIDYGQGYYIGRPADRPLAGLSDHKG